MTKKDCHKKLGLKINNPIKNPGVAGKNSIDEIILRLEKNYLVPIIKI